MHKPAARLRPLALSASLYLWRYQGRRWPWQLNYDAAAAWLPESSSCVGERATQTGGGRLRKRARTSSGSSGVGGEGCSGRLGWAVGSRAAPGSAPAAQLAG